MNVVDSSGWLEYFAGGPQADFFAVPIQDVDALVVPAVCIYEVFKQVLQQRGQGDALTAVSIMQEGQIVDLDSNLALHAASLSDAHKLPMADSMILATARRFDAEVWTMDADFEGLPGVRYAEKG